MLRFGCQRKNGERARRARVGWSWVSVRGKGSIFRPSSPGAASFGGSAVRARVSECKRTVKRMWCCGCCGCRSCLRAQHVRAVWGEQARYE